MSTLEDLQRLTPQEREKVLSALIAQVNSGKLTSKWVPNKGPQTEAYLSQADILLYGGAGGGGKGGRILTDPATLHRLGVSELDSDKIQELKLMEHQVLTPKGYIALSDIVIGQDVCNPDGTIAKVIAIHDRGVQPFYKLTFIDGASVEVDASHVWPISFSGSRKNRKRDKIEVPSGLPSNEEWNFRYSQRFNLLTTDQLFAEFNKEKESQADQRKSWPAIPLTDPVNLTFPAGRWQRLPPYTLGVLLGDGSLGTAGNVSWTKPEPEVAERVSAELEAYSCPYEITVRGDVEKGCYGLKMKEGAEEPLANIIYRMGLQVKSEGKFIPKSYLLAPIDQRWQLARGLFDTDGYADDRGHIEYSSASYQLAKDVQFLVQSLGFAATLSKKEEPAYTHNDEKRIGQPSWRLYIKGRNNADLFNLKRKHARCAAYKYNGGAGDVWPNRRLISIEKVEDSVCRCITVNNLNGLYITNDFIVTHNSDLEIGLALTQHKKTLIMRRKYTDLDGLIDRTLEVYGSRQGFNGSPPPKLRTTDGRLITFGAANEVGKEQGRQGQAIDLLCLDEATQFAESQVRFLMGWIRTTVKGQRTRVIMASNPPLSDEGVWVIKMFAPWLDPAHPNPAKYGELRWFVTTDDGTGVQDIEVDGPGEHLINGDSLLALSRTFIPAKRDDNPFLNKEYKAQQDALPKHLRDAVRDGNFMAARVDHELQFIPTDWIVAAQERWTNTPPQNTPMCAMGVDCASGGTDFTVIASRYDGWYAPLIAVPGIQTPLGSDIAGLVIKHRQNQAKVIIDMGGGYGGGAYERLTDNIGRDFVVGYKGATGSRARAKQGNLEYFNKRAEAYGRFKEALDPDQPGGSPIALPKDPVLVADLCSIRLEKDDLSILKLEAKDKMVARIGRSTDRGDAVVMAWYDGAKTSTHYQQWQAVNRNYGSGSYGNVRVLRGYENAKRRR